MRIFPHLKAPGTYLESGDISNRLIVLDKFWLTAAKRIPIFAQIRGLP
jgi:hypothetical protein